MDIMGTAARAEWHLRSAADLFKRVHDALYGMDTDAADVVADEFAAAQWDAEFALERLPATMSKAQRLLQGQDEPGESS